MRYSPIQGTDLNASVICMGTGVIGSAADRETSFRMLDYYLDQGGNFIDTAKVYADWLPKIERSISEKTIGAWMEVRGNRSKVILATKGAHPDLNTMDIPRLTRKEIAADLDASLSHLRTEAIDLYWLHRDDPARPVEDILETLNRQVEAGKIRYLGASNWSLGRLQAAQAAASQHGITGFAASQVYWNVGQADPQRIGDKTLAFMDAGMWRYHQETGLAAVAYTSQANGYFTRRACGEPVSDALKSVYHLEENEARLARLIALSGQASLSASQIVLAYLTSQPFPAFPIIGCRTLDQLRDSLTAADVTLSPEQVAYLADMKINQGDK